jgi:hypothetical protein
LATAITALNGSSSPGNVGDATFQISTEYTPDTGWDSKIGMQVRAAADGVFTDAGLFIEAKADGTARIIQIASQHVFASDDGANTVNPIVFDEDGNATFNDITVDGAFIKDATIVNAKLFPLRIESLAA